ncbi:MAG TPA: chorismate mutase [Acetobacteraceae bacterium]|nr:chorismate mutase [Acetobacteraceae bacterium]
MSENREQGALAGDLARLRGELDRFDDAIHDLLMRRAEVVERVGAAKSAVALRPGREASIIRRLLARHAGALPQQAVVRIWRELLAGTTAMQRPFVIAVCDPDPARAYTQLAREQYGALTPLHVHSGPAQALAEIAAGTASIAVLPLPSEDESAQAAWWTALMPQGARIRVIARLPFWSVRPEGAPAVAALVAGALMPDASGEDRSLIGLELAEGVSRARLAAALASADLQSDTLLMRRDPGQSRALADVRGLVEDDDPRLARLEAPVVRAVVLGAYAVPIGNGGNAP